MILALACYLKIYKNFVLSFCTLGIEWKFSNRRHKAFEAKYLSKISCNWKYFACSRLMPTIHYSTWDKERAILLFIITSTKSMDGGISTNNHHLSYFFLNSLQHYMLKRGWNFVRVRFCYSWIKYWLQYTWVNSPLGQKGTQREKGPILLQKI